MHRCEGCRWKQASLSFSASFGGKATISTGNGEENVLLTISALSTYLCGAGCMFNDVEVIEDYFLQSPAFDLTISVDSFLLSIQPAECEGGPSEAAGSASSMEEQLGSDSEATDKGDAAFALSVA